MRIFPVVHIETSETAIEQAHLALDAGADGVYLIDHHQQDPSRLLLTFDAVTANLDSDTYVGVNLLGKGSSTALDIIKATYDQGLIRRIPDGLWVDDARITGTVDSAKAVMERKCADPALRDIRLLGGVAFKYTRTYTDNPVDAAREASELQDAVDVVTTSGSGTGFSPSVEKLSAIREASSKPVAVASGISAKNLAQYSGLIDEILVASSVETKPYSGVFDREKLEQMIAAAHKQS